MPDPYMTTRHVADVLERVAIAQAAVDAVHAAAAARALAEAQQARQRPAGPRDGGPGE